jgi:hypothetical protein
MLWRVGKELNPLSLEGSPLELKVEELIRPDTTFLLDSGSWAGTSRINEGPVWRGGIF